MAERKIQVSGMPEGHGVDAARVQGTIEKFYDKLASRLPGELFLEIHFKEGHRQGKGGKREQIEAHAKAVVGGILLYSKHIEWDAEKAVHIALESLLKETDKAIHKKI